MENKTNFFEQIFEKFKKDPSYNDKITEEVSLMVLNEQLSTLKAIIEDKE